MFHSLLDEESEIKHVSTCLFVSLDFPHTLQLIVFEIAKVLRHSDYHDDELTSLQYLILTDSCLWTS